MLYLFLTEIYLHCVKLVTADDLTETKDDALHVIEVMIRYSNGTATKFIWKGPKSNSEQVEICKDFETLVDLVYVEAVWIRQHGSKNAWFARSILVQDNVGSSIYMQYGLTPQVSDFWTDG